MNAHATTGPAPRRLLVVDDDQRTANRLAQMLREDGFVVEVLADGRAALDRLEWGPPPSAIITDLIMPRAGGIAVLGEARRRWKHIPVVFVTGHPELLSPLPVYFDPAPLVLTKPISYTELSEALERLVPPL